MLKTRVVNDGEVKTLALSGRLDTSSAPQLESEGISLISKGCKALVVDLSGLEYISSSGLRALLSIAKKIMPLGGKLALCCAGGLIKDVLSLSGFSTLIPVKETHTEAVAACSPSVGGDSGK